MVRSKHVLAIIAGVLWQVATQTPYVVAPAAVCTLAALDSIVRGRHDD